MSKWIVQLDYEFGEIEPNSIYFRRVCSDDVEYSSAYETKREALEAFCSGQVAMNKMLKETEAEQKPEERIDVVRDFSPEGLERRFGDWNEAIREAHKSPIEKVEERLDLLERYLGISKAKMKQTVATLFVEQDKRIEALEKKVEGIEKDLYKVSHLLGKDDSTDELKISKLDVASQKIDLLLKFLEAVCRNLGNDIKKIK